jgi:outer membrane beta-barrel protein
MNRLIALLVVVVSLSSLGSAPEGAAGGNVPLGDENAAVHVIQKKQYSDSHKHEFALYPAAIQVNGKFTQHVGTGVSYTYHLNENFGFQLLGQYNWRTAESGFSKELIQKLNQAPAAATSLLLAWGLQAGVEVTPVYGKFAFLENNLIHFAVVLNGGAGFGGTQHQLKPAIPPGPATFGDTGVRFLGSVGGGVRLQVGDHFAFRLELRDLVYTARVSKVNGCSADDLGAMQTQLDQGQGVTSATVSPGCDVGRFNGNRSNDVQLAFNLVKVPSSDVLNNLMFYAGFAFVY